MTFYYLAQTISSSIIISPLASYSHTNGFSFLVENLVIADDHVQIILIYMWDMINLEM